MPYFHTPENQMFSNVLEVIEIEIGVKKVNTMG